MMIENKQGVLMYYNDTMGQYEPLIRITELPDLEADPVPEDNIQLQLLKASFGKLSGTIDCNIRTFKMLNMVFRRAAFYNAINANDRRKIKRAKRKLREYIRKCKEEKDD